MDAQKILVKVQTEHGMAAFWLHEMRHMEDLQTVGSIIVLEPIIGEPRTIRSKWNVSRIIELIDVATG